MFSLFKKNSEVPEWASFMDGRQYNDFLKAVEDYFGKKNVHFRINDGTLYAETDMFGAEQLGLSNVAQMCGQEKRGQYSRIVADHFDAMLNAQKFDKEFQQIVHDFEKVKQYIGVRLYPNDYAGMLEEGNTMGRMLAEHIYAMLIFDFPYSITNIKHEQAAQWNKDPDELFELGLQNIKNNYKMVISEQQFDDMKLWIVQGDHFFTPNIAMELEDHPAMIGTQGALVGIPHRHIVIIYPIETMAVANAINKLIPTIYGMHREGPGSVSNHLFWYKDGLLEDLPYEFDEGALRFFPTQRFVEMLNGIANPNNN